MSLKINIHHIREHKSGQIAGRFDIRPQELDLPAPKDIWRPLIFDFVCTNAGDFFVLQGKLTSSTAHQCSRCLSPVDIPLEVDVHEEFSRHPAEEDDDIHLFWGDEIDITEVLRENVILSLPIKPLCSPDCRGLCAYCGTDLNQASCGCKPQSVDPRLAALEKLISKQ
jgi:uncharacterized protein